jgi:hypothetical protein
MYREKCLSLFPSYLAMPKQVSYYSQFFDVFLKRKSRTLITYAK